MRKDQIQVSELRSLAEGIFTDLEESGIQTITMDHDYYWHVHDTDAFGMAENPQLACGQLFDDIVDIRGELAELAVGARAGGYFNSQHALSHLAPMLNYIAFRLTSGGLKMQPRSPM
jgi:hypothetical protein